MPRNSLAQDRSSIPRRTLVRWALHCDLDLVYWKWRSLDSLDRCRLYGLSRLINHRSPRLSSPSLFCQSCHSYSCRTCLWWQKFSKLVLQKKNNNNFFCPQLHLECQMKFLANIAVWWNRDGDEEFGEIDFAWVVRIEYLKHLSAEFLRLALRIELFVHFGEFLRK